MEQNNLQKTLEVKKQAIATETIRLEHVKNNMEKLKVEIEQFKQDYQNKINEMTNQYSILEQSYNNGKHFV